MKIIGILLAAGEGTRTKFSVPKQIFKIEKTLLFQHSLDPLIKSYNYERIIIVASKKTYTEIRATVNKYYKGYNINIILGGINRQKSTKKAIQYVVSKKISCDLMLFHDAVRPFIKTDDFKKIISQSFKKDGAIFTETVRGSIAISINKNHISKYGREFPYMTHTPECYKFETIKNIYIKPKIKYSSKLSNLELMLLHKKNIVPVFSNTLNLKITFPEDINFMKIYFKLK